MKSLIIGLLIWCCMPTTYAQQNTITKERVENSYFKTKNLKELKSKFAALPCGISVKDSMSTVIAKLEKFLKTFVPDSTYPDDRYAIASCLEALTGIKEGGYGIGAVLIDNKGNIIAGAHNNQIQLNRSDLHGEMTLLTNFEQKDKAKQYMNGYVYKKGVFTSLEPCPMCFIRLATAELDTRYASPDPDGGMVTKAACLPSSWRDLAARQTFEQGNCSPILQKIGHLLSFYTFLDGRGPYKSVSESELK